MSARVLVVDDIAANLRLLEAKLTSEYYEVCTAEDGLAALEIVREQTPDIVLLDVMMPGMDGFEVCRTIKQDPKFMGIPVVMVTALDDASDRIKGLEAGADDFLTKPVQDLQMFARIKSLVRLKRSAEELDMRQTLSGQLGDELQAPIPLDQEIPGVVLLVQDRRPGICRITEALESVGHVVSHADTLDAAKDMARQEEFSLFIVDDFVEGEDGIRLCAWLRSQEGTRHAAILISAGESEMDRLAKALELGVNDYIIRPVDADEIILRARAQIRRTLYEDRLRESQLNSMNAALIDELTGIYNRRYLDAHFRNLQPKLAEGNRQISLLMLDIDFFKDVNDSYGHAAGDEVLKALSERVRSNLRGFDSAIRVGGEEFIVLLPDANMAVAHTAAVRLREVVAGRPFRISVEPFEIKVSVSIGVATLAARGANLDQLLSDADAAMYEAKSAGRDCVRPELETRPEQNVYVPLNKLEYS